MAEHTPSFHDVPLDFSEFDVPTYEAWVEETLRTLKGTPFEKLITRTYEGLDVQPIYRRQDVENLAHAQTLPGHAPFVRGKSINGDTSWYIAQEIPYGSPQKLNEALKHDLARGQTAVYLVVDAATADNLDPDQAQIYDVGMGGTSLAHKDDVLTALEGVSLAGMPLYVEASETAQPLAALIIAALKSRGDDLNALYGAIDADPLGTLAQSGGLLLPIENAYDDMAALTRWAVENVPEIATIRVSTVPYNSAGVNAVQELAYAIATGTAYLNAMLERGFEVNEVAPRMRFVFAVGSNFFMEIAKLRAAKMLWQQVVEAFGGDAEAQKMRLHIRTSTYNKTVNDPYVNMLRATTEGLAAAVAGVESMYTAPFDEPITAPDDFSRRIARNVQIILQEEANITRVIDPAGGSFYVEHLTDQLAQKAWAQFQQIEASGGMLEALKSEKIQSDIAGVAVQRQENFAQRKHVLIGTNKYPNLSESLPDNDPDYEALFKERSQEIEQKRRPVEISNGNFDVLVQAAGQGATLNQLFTAVHGQHDGSEEIEPLHIHRLAGGFEALRSAADEYAAQHGHRPRIFLANMGPLRQHKARADFTSGFYEVGGFEIINPAGFNTPEAAARAALDSGAGVTVICSTDDTYPELVPPLVRAIKAQKPDIIVILAGYPQDQIEAHRAAGVDDFIHFRANCYDMNLKLQQQIGVR